MSTALVEAEIGRFLGTPDAEVLCIRGRWGVGKTYTWNTLVRAASKENKIALESYSYVSLFGLDSIEQVKYAISENGVASTDIAVEPGIKSFKGNADAVAKQLGKPWLSVIRRLPQVEKYGTALQAMLFMSIRGRIVCFDDLERTGANLRIRDVLGLASQLRDQKACKVVLILNEGQLVDDNKKDFERYNEKVVDVSIEFAPDANDCARIALTDKGTEFDLLREAVIALGISNIRIIKKAERFVRRLAPLVETFEPGVLEQTVRTLALLTWSTYGKAENAPPIDFVRRERGRRFHGLEQEEETPERREWNRLLDEFGFAIMDEYDELLLQGIERGFFDQAALLDRAKKLNEQFAEAKAHGSLKQAWSLYHNTFADNESELVSNLVDSLHQNVRFVSPNDLNAIVRLLKELNHAKEATDAIEYYVNHRSDDGPELFDLSQDPFGGEVTDPDVRAAFWDISTANVDDRSPADILLSISRNNSWKRSDIARLAELSVDDFYNLFKSTTGKDLGRIVRTSLLFDAVGDVGSPERQITPNAKEALRRIGRESPLNKRRVERKYEVRVDDEGGPPT